MKGGKIVVGEVSNYEALMQRRIAYLEDVGSKGSEAYQMFCKGGVAELRSVLANLQYARFEPDAVRDGDGEGA